MRNHIQPGNTITLTAPAALASGDPVKVGAFFGVASTTAASGAKVEVALTGVYRLPKVTSANSDEAWAVGDVIYWNATAKKLSKVATGNVKVGAATEAAAAGATTGAVRLDGVAAA